MVHYEMTKKDSLIYANNGAFGVVMIRPHKVFEDTGHIQLPSIRVVEIVSFQSYYNQHEVHTISKEAFEQVFVNVSGQIMDYDRKAYEESIRY